MALNKSFCAGFVAGFGTSELIRKIFKTVGQAVNDMTDTGINEETEEKAEEAAPETTEQEATTEPAAQEETTEEVPVVETPKKKKK